MKSTVVRIKAILPYLCFVAGLMTGISIVWLQGVERLYRKDIESEILRSLTLSAERKNQTLDELVMALKEKGIKFELDKQESSSQNHSTVYIVNEPILNLFGFGSRWIVDLKIDKNGRVLQADYESEPVGWL